MKRVLLILLQLLIISSSFSQDIITKKTGEDIKAKVIEVNPTDIKYKKHGSQSGPTYTIDKNEILMVQYEDGTKDIFNEQIEKNKISNSKKIENMYEKGIEDANLYYKGKNSGAGWTAFTTVITSPLIGLIPAAACSSTEPSDENLNYMDRELMKDPDYHRAYTQQAHKIKRKKVWTSFGIGSIGWLFVILIANGGA